MAILRQRLNRLNNRGEYDTIHYETSANLVLLANGQTVEYFSTHHTHKFGDIDGIDTTVTQWEEKVKEFETALQNISLNVGKLQSLHTQTIIEITKDKWSSDNKQYTYTGGHFKTTDTLIVSPKPGSEVDYGVAGVRAVAQGDNSITFECDTIPENTITVNVAAFDSIAEEIVLQKINADVEVLNVAGDEAQGLAKIASRVSGSSGDDVETKINEITDKLAKMQENVNLVNEKLQTKQSLHSTREITIATGNWTVSNKEYTYSGLECATGDTLVVAPKPGYEKVYANYGVRAIAQGTNSVTFKCEIIPNETVVVNVAVFPITPGGK